MTPRKSTTPSRSDAGLTLVELLAAVAITGVIIPALTGALVIGWRTTDDTIARLSDNRNRALTPSLWTRDVQSASKLNDGTVTACLSPGDTPLAKFSWDETPASGPPATTRVVTWVWTGSTTGLVERRFCATGGSITSSVAAAHDVKTAPGIVCRDVVGGSTTACGTTPRVVEISVTDPSGTFVATGRRRAR